MVGRSNIVGMPVAAMLQAANATGRCATETRILRHVRRADIVVAALGRAEAVKELAGPVPSTSASTRSRTRRESADTVLWATSSTGGAQVYSAITPVPGGWGR